MCARVELGKLQNDLEVFRGHNVYLERDAKSAKETCTKAYAMAVGRDAETMKVKRRLPELCSRFDERVEKLWVVTSAANARVEEVKDYQASIYRSKNSVMEEGECVAALKIADVEKMTQLAELERVKANAARTLGNVQGERNALVWQLAEAWTSSLAKKRSVATARRMNLPDLYREVELVVTRAFEGFD